MTTEYEAVMGLEIHARLKTNSKMFCSCSNDTWQAESNSHVCPVCMGFPGALPTVNAEAVHLGMLTALALKCQVVPFSKFDRKSYFYPDLPAGYQISQYDMPLSQKGAVTVLVDGMEKQFGITRLHLENDAGKLVHSGDKSLVDFNRAGSPLMEIVTEPDFRTPQEAAAFLKELQRILRLLNASDADMEKGMMRCDVNVSVRKKGAEKFGTKVEVKNMNSFRNIEKALEFEIKRQTELLEKGEAIVQETRGWDDQKEVTLGQRTKEEAMDYRYFPEPDIPPLTVSAEKIEELQKELPELPAVKMNRFNREYSISLTDAETLVSDLDLCRFFEETATLSKNPQKAANWVLSEVLAVVNELQKAASELPFSAAELAGLIQMIERGEISSKIAKEIFAEMKTHGGSPEAIAAKKGLSQMSDTAELEKISAEVIAENPQIVEDYKNGKERAFGALVGQVMKKTGGKANPGVVNQILKNLILQS